MSELPMTPVAKVAQEYQDNKVVSEQLTPGHYYRHWENGVDFVGPKDTLDLSRDEALDASLWDNAQAAVRSDVAPTPRSRAEEIEAALFRMTTEQLNQRFDALTKTIGQLHQV